MSIHPAAIIEEGTELGAGCVVQAHAIIRRHSVLGAGVVVHPFAVIGGDPQDLKFEPATVSGVRVGARTVVREGVTLNRATRPGGFTEIGADCYLMACCHVGHDCRVGDHVVLANGVLLAGHVSVGDHAFLGGAALVHQFVRIGERTMISGATRAAQDVPPFAMAAERNEIIGLNLLGLKRGGFSPAAVGEIKEAFRTVYFTPGNLPAVARAALDGGAFRTDEARRFLTFFTEGRRGFARARRQGRATRDDVA